MHTSTLFTLALVGAATAANSTVVSLIFPGYAAGEDNYQVVGSIIASVRVTSRTSFCWRVCSDESQDSAATTYSLACVDTSDDSECGIPTSFTFVEGPSTIHYLMTLPYSATTIYQELNCQVTPAPSPSGVCTVTAVQTDGLETSSSTSTLFLNNPSYAPYVGTLPVTITAGPTALANSPISTTGSASPTAEPPSNAAGVAGNSSARSTTRLSTGGAPKVTGAPWALGAAAALAYAAW